MNNDQAKQAMIQQLMAQGPSQPSPQPGPAQESQQMAPEQAMQILQKLGITPENLPVVAQAVQTVMQAQQQPAQAPPQ